MLMTMVKLMVVLARARFCCSSGLGSCVVPQAAPRETHTLVLGGGGELVRDRGVKGWVVDGELVGV